MSENRHPNKKRRASSTDEQSKRIRLPQGRAAAAAVSIAATSANVSHGSTNRVGSNSNKRAREELSTVPSSIIKRARANPAPAPATLPLDLPFTLAPPAPRVPKSNKLSAEEVPIYGYRSTEQQLQLAAAALIALAQQAQNINKRSSIDEAVTLPGGKRIRIEAPVVSSNNNGIGRPRSNRRRRNNVEGPIPIWNLSTAPAPTAPAPEATAATSTASNQAPTEPTAATSTATAGNQAASNDYYISSSDESSEVSSDNESLSGMALLSGMPGGSSPGQQSSSSTSSSWDDNYSHLDDVEMSDINTDDETSLAGINLLPAIDEGKSVIKIQANFRGYIVRNLKPRAAPQAESDANGGGDQEQECDGNLNDVSSLSEDEEWSGEEDDNAMIQSVLKVAPASTGDDNDEEDEESSNTENNGASIRTEEVHFGDEDDVASTTEEEEDEESSNTEDNGVSIQTEVHFEANNAVEEDGDEDDVVSTTEEEDDEPSNTEDDGASFQDGVNRQQFSIVLSQLVSTVKRKERKIRYAKLERARLECGLNGRYWTEPTTRRRVMRR